MSAYESDEDFLTAVARFGGMPPVFLRYPQWAASFLPALRADFRVCDGFAYVDRGALTLPLTVLCGDRDPLAPVADIAHWRQHTTGVYRECVLPGDHFFINQHASVAAAMLTLGDTPVRFSQGHTLRTHQAFVAWYRR